MGAFGPLYTNIPRIYAPVSKLTPFIHYNAHVLPSKSLPAQRFPPNAPDGLLEVKIFRHELWKP